MINTFIHQKLKNLKSKIDTRKLYAIVKKRIWYKHVMKYEKQHYLTHQQTIFKISDKNQ